MAHPTDFEPARSWALHIAAIALIIFSLVARFIPVGWLLFIPVGWFLIPGVFFYPLISGAHYFFHDRAIPKLGSIRRSLLVLMLVSHSFFLLAFLLQWDFSESPNSWLTITAWFRLFGLRGSAQPPAWWPAGRAISPSNMNLLLFLPVVVTWLLLFMAAKRTRDT